MFELLNTETNITINIRFKVKIHESQNSRKSNKIHQRKGEI